MSLLTKAKLELREVLGKGALWRAIWTTGEVDQS